MGDTQLCRIGDTTVLLDVGSEVHPAAAKNFELWRAQTFATKEPDTLDWLRSELRPGDVLYDVGANIGQYSLYAAKVNTVQLSITIASRKAVWG